MRILHFLTALTLLFLFASGKINAAQCIASDLSSLNACLASGDTVNIQANIIGGNIVLKNNTNHVIILNTYQLSGSWTGGNGNTTVKANSVIVVNNNGGTPNVNILNTTYGGSLNALLAPLPVDLSLFQVSLVDGYAWLIWSTATERDNLGFDVEWSTDAVRWVSIGQEFALSPNSDEKRDYSFLHKNPQSGINYYRLQQKDISGRISYSPVRTLNFSSHDGTGILVYPNPASERFTITGSGQLTTLMVYDALGRLMQTVPQLNDVYEMQVDQWPAGIYRLLFITGDVQNSTTIQVEHK